jgi:molybdopterin-containing oxidoreductase family iron-sulfur binding subunit
MDNKDKDTSRRSFLRKGLTLGAGAVAGLGAVSALGSSEGKTKRGEKVKLLTADGKLVEVDKADVDCKTADCEPAQGKAARKGIPGRNFVMVIDLSKCANARKCIEGCQEGHDLLPSQEWIPVHLLQDNQNGDPYWFPKPCYHCDNPPCVKVCPVGATFKRTDNAVLIDFERCIGCKFCISACPYSARRFNWENLDTYVDNHPDYSPETSLPAQHGVASKCDFCPDRAREGKLPYCASSCPMGAIYFGDANEDTITNGEETVRFRETLEVKAGYRYLEDLGTDPNVYYLPPVDRMFPYKRGLKNLTEEQLKGYDDILSKTDK